MQGEVTIANSELDDLILLRADGTTTYNFSVVVDDHDMEITHVIRGDDHLNNAFRQTQIYRALAWPVPEFAHVPLIHGPDGAKMSKRHGAIGVEQYRQLGYLPEALRNYLLRLGWSHGDDEIISTAQAIEWFDLDAVGRSPARFDMEKLLSLNAHYIKEVDAARLIPPVLERIEAQLGRRLTGEERRRLDAALAGLRPRTRSLNEIADGAMFLFQSRPLTLDPGGFLDQRQHLITEVLAKAGVQVDAQYLEGMAKAGDKLVVLLDIDRVLVGDEVAPVADATHE